MHLQVQQKEKLATIALMFRYFLKQKKSLVWIGLLFFLALMYLMIGFVSIAKNRKCGSCPCTGSMFMERLINDFRAGGDDGKKGGGASCKPARHVDACRTAMTP